MKGKNVPQVRNTNEVWTAGLLAERTFTIEFYSRLRRRALRRISYAQKWVDTQAQALDLVNTAAVRTLDALHQGLIAAVARRECQRLEDAIAVLRAFASSALVYCTKEWLRGDFRKVKRQSPLPADDGVDSDGMYVESSEALIAVTPDPARELEASDRLREVLWSALAFNDRRQQAFHGLMAIELPLRNIYDSSTMSASQRSKAVYEVRSLLEQGFIQRKRKDSV